jgi:DNA-binding transcriptional LysR family regulator
MEMHQVRYFLAVVSHLNFTRAAEELQVAQPSLTRAIQKLETELGGALFRRERRNTHLTELGRTMLPHLKAAFVAAETAKTQAARLRRKHIGSLSLGVCSGIDARAPAALVAAAARKLSNVDISVEVADAEVVERRLLAGEFDAAILASLQGAHERFVFTPILTEDIVVVFVEGHRFAECQAIGIEDLNGEPLIVGSGFRFDENLSNGLETPRVAAHQSYRSNDVLWVAEFVRNGLGCAVMPRSTALSHGLEHCNLEGPPLRHRTMLATVAGRRHSSAVTMLIQQVAIGVTPEQVLTPKAASGGLDPPHFRKALAGRV